MKKEQKNRKKIPLLPQLLCGFVLSFTFFVFAPIDMYVLNSQNFWFRLGDFVPTFLMIFAGAFVAIQIVFFVARLLPYSLYLLLMAVMFGVMVAVYVQGTYLCLSNDVLGGGALAWNTMCTSTLINLAIWAAIILAAIGFMLMKPRLFLKIVAYLSALILVMEGVSLGVSLANANLSKDLDNLYCTDKDQFVYSENGDVLVFMMDTLDTRIFDEILANDPEYLEELDGFTYYRNAASCYRKTDPSVVSMLTGEICLNEEPFFTYANNAFRESKFFQTMVDNGMTVDVYAAPNGIFTSDLIGQIDNLASQESYVSDVKEFSKTMISMVGFRYAPLALQPFLFGEYDALFNECQEYVEGQLPGTYANESVLKSNMNKIGVSFDDDRRFFKYYCLQGAHTPYNLNRNGESVENDSVDQYEHTLGSISVLSGLLKNLKVNGAYDNSTIIILADHGIDWIGNPTFLVKYPGDNWEDGLKTSMAPVSLLDLRATVLYGAGLDYEEFGTPVQMWEGVEERERLFYAYDWVKPTGYEFYLNELTEYIVPADATQVDAYIENNRYNANSAKD